MNQLERRFLIGQRLDQLVALGRALDFQNLAFHVAKRLYPGLALSEWNHDGGEDAFALPGDEAAPGTPTLACSFTATLTKIKADCERLRVRGVQPSHVIFITPKAVERNTIDRWKTEVEEEFGHGLEVLSRSGLVAELEHPDLGWVCRDYLGLHQPGRLDVTEIGARGRAAANLRIQSWEREAGDPARQIVLTVRPVEGSESSGMVSVPSVDTLAAALRAARRLILLGSPGGGKTITVTQVARRLYGESGAHVPVVVPAGEWATSGSSLVDFVAAELTVTVDELHTLDGAGLLTLLLNGWNEIPGADRTRAMHALSTFARRLPNAGILLTTRLISDRPALPRAEAFQLDSLSRAGRRELIRRAEIAVPDDLISDLEQDEVLDALTRTPLFLTVAIAIVREGRSLPRSAWALLDEFVGGVEQGDHGSAIIEITRGDHRRYLADLSAPLMTGGGTSLRTDEALHLIGETSMRLGQAGLLGQVPDAGAVLQVLTAHHVLVAPIGTSGTIRFQHQQFQAWAAAEWLQDEIARVRSAVSPSAVAAIQRDVLSRPSWTDAIHLLVDRLSQNPEGSSTLTDLLLWLVPVDLLFAASCIPMGGEGAWAAIGTPVAAALATLRQRPGREEQAYATAGMLATANPTFADVLWPLLESDDTQVRLGTFRAWRPLSLRSLGPKWSERLSQLTADQREEFVHEFIMNGLAHERHEILEFASSDPSIEVRMTAISMLDFIGDSDAALIMLGTDATLWARPEAGYVIRDLATETVRQLETTLRSAAAIAKPGLHRWPLLHALAEAGAPGSVEAIQDECANAAPDHLAENLIPYMHRINPEWATEWILARVESGREVPDAVAVLAPAAAPDRVRALVEVALHDPAWSERPVQARLAMLVRIAGTSAAIPVLEELRRAYHRDLVADPKRTFWHHCEHLVRSMPLATRAEAVLALEGFPRDEMDFMLLRRLLGPGSAMEAPEIEDMSAEQRITIRNMLLAAHDGIMPASSYPRDFRYGLATLLGSFGDSGNAETLLRWAREDSDDRARLIAARDPGAPMSYSNWYAGAFVRLRSPASGPALVQLLEDPEYLGGASLALAALAKPDDPSTGRQWPRRTHYREARERRVALAAGSIPEAFDSPDVISFRVAIRDAVARHLARIDSGQSRPTPHSLGEAAKALGQLGDVSAIPLLLNLGHRPGCEWGVIDALNALVLQGKNVPGAEIADLVQPLIEQAAKGDSAGAPDSWWFGQRCLEVLLLSDSPDHGVEQVRRVLPRLQRHHHIRDLMPLLAASQARHAELLLLELLRTTDPSALEFPDLVEALAEYHSGAVTTALLDLLDSVDTRRITYSAEDALVRALASLGREDVSVVPLLEARAREATEPRPRELLAKILLEVGGDAAALVGSELLRDAAPNPIPFGVRRLVERVTQHHEPIGESGAYSIRPRAAPELRSRLFALLMTDATRQESARRLLLMIEEDRIQTGRPSDESRYPGEIGSTPVVSLWLSSSSAPLPGKDAKIENLTDFADLPLQ